MLSYKSLDNDEVVIGDQIIASMAPTIARVIGGSYHIEHRDGESHPWIEVQNGSDVLIGEVGDYAFSRDDGETYFFVKEEDFIDNWEEIYDPEIDGDQNKYFDPSVDVHRQPDPTISGSAASFVLEEDPLNQLIG